jgi:hypothetical protein
MKSILNNMYEFLFGCDPKVGETWGILTRQKNPFMEAEFYEVNVIDVKDDWVKYHDLYGKKYVSTIPAFKYYYEKLSQ